MYKRQDDVERRFRPLIGVRHIFFHLDKLAVIFRCFLMLALRFDGVR